MPAARMNKGKPMFSFILDFPKALLGFCRVKEIGAIKYTVDNWKKGGKSDREYLDAALRHMVAFKSGEQFADDTGCHHLIHAAWNLFALLELNVDEVYDVEKFTAACEYWRARKAPSTGNGEALFDKIRAEFPEVMSRMDAEILDRVRAFLVDKKTTND